MKFKSLLVGSLVLACMFAGNAYAENYSNATAQGVALIQASRCRMGHCGGNRGLEGVGMGPTAQAAIRACCYYGRYQAKEIGVAQGRNGMWYACVRY